MNKNYFSENEEKGHELFGELSETLHITATGATPEGLYYDCSGYTHDGRYIAAENKIRAMRLEDDKLVGTTKKFQTTTVMIEAHKLAELSLAALLKGAIPLYINYIENATIVFNIAQLSGIPKSKRMSIDSTGYGNTEVETRFFLPISEAYIYDKNNKLIKSPNR